MKMKMMKMHGEDRWPPYLKIGCDFKKSIEKRIENFLLVSLTAKSEQLLAPYGGGCAKIS